ncbi:MAG: hypothetical protein RLZZ453_1006 [Chlamydiota bacterium]|jgi:ADP-heptose:LPS heptosyltransferase
MKNSLIRKIIKRVKRRKCEEGEKRFLVLSTTGLGDTLWATPALRALRSTFPSSRIFVLTSLIGKQLLANNRNIDGLFGYKDALIPLFFRLRKEKITHVISFHTSQRAVLPFACLLGAGSVIGSYGINKGLDDLLTHAVDHGRVHEIQRRLDLVATLGAYTPDPSMEVFPGLEEEKEAQVMVAKLQMPSYLPLVVLHPGSKDCFKQWPVSHFVELGRRLCQTVGCKVIVTGNAEEAALCNSIAASIPDATALTGLPLLSLAALFKHVQLFIGNDTGPMHLAFAQKTPAIGLFSATDPVLCGPYGNTEALAIHKKPTCTPCLKKKCREPFCLRQIGIDEVYQAAFSILYRT